MQPFSDAYTIGKKAFDVTITAIDGEPMRYQAVYQSTKGEAVTLVLQHTGKAWIADKEGYEEHVQMIGFLIEEQFA